MIEPLASPFQDTFRAFGDAITVSCLMCSPYVTLPPVKTLVQSLYDRDWHNTAQVNLLTDISLANLVQGATDIAALIYLQENVTNVRVSHLPRVHAKVYVADERLAIIGSANWTAGGEVKNYEYGLRVDEPDLVRRIHDDISHYASLGGEATAKDLRDLQKQIVPLRTIARDSRKALRDAIKASKQEQAVEEILLHLRVKGRTVNGIFSDTILYLLKSAPMTTPQLHAHIQQIHPDLCDDTLYRVIGGEQYKKWKHQVRAAQSTLKKQGLVVLDKQGSLWSLTA